MLCGRTILELIVAQVVVLAAFLLAPFDLVDAIGTLGAAVVAMAIAAVVATVLFLRHRNRVAKHGSFEQKIENLRRSQTT